MEEVQLADTLVSGRITYGARCTGTGQAACELTAKYAKERIQFGKPISQHQINRFRIAEMAKYLDVMLRCANRVARLYDQELVKSTFAGLKQRMKSVGGKRLGF